MGTPATEENTNVRCYRNPAVDCSVHCIANDGTRCRALHAETIAADALHEIERALPRLEDQLRLSLDALSATQR